MSYKNLLMDKITETKRITPASNSVSAIILQIV